MNKNNRSDGWKFAKKSGHLNEDIIAEKITNDLEFRENLFNRLNINEKFLGVYETGLNEKTVESILENRTKKKSDLTIFLENNKIINLSIKKSTSGQVYLIPVDRFIEGFEIQFKKIIPENVKEAMYLFWGSDYKNNIIDDIIIDYGTNLIYENKKRRLVAETLESFDSNLSYNLLNWFKENIFEITIFCFSSGLVKDQSLFAHYIWYKNLIDNNQIDYIFPIEEIARLSKNHINNIKFGNINGGTTISLPFGFVQWHKHCMQFHHKLDSILNLKGI